MNFKNLFRSKSKGSTPKSKIREFIETILISGILAAFIIIFVVQSFVVKGQSMEPTLHNGERLFVNKFIYRFSDPQRGDIIVFRPDGAPKERFIKRVIGLPGDTIEIKNGKVIVNGVAIDEEEYTAVPTEPNFGPYHVPEDHVFVMGDNRIYGESADSRMVTPVGYVDYKSIYGKAFITYWPIPQTRIIKSPEYENLIE